MLVSVVLPVYNGMPYLQKAIESVLAQDCDFELLISDDGSRDGSAELIARLSDTRIRTLNNKTNLGIFGNLNSCIAAAAGEYIQVFGQDDLMEPGYLASQAALLEKYPETGLVYNQPNYIGSDDTSRFFHILHAPEVIDKRTYLWLASHYGALPPNISSIMIRRRVFDEVGFFSTDYRIIGDIEFYNRVSERFPIVYNKKALHSVRSHAGQTSSPLKSGPISLREEIGLEHWYRSRWSAADYRKVKRFRSAWRGRFHFGWIRRLLYKGKIRQAVRELMLLNRLYPLHLVMWAAVAGRVRPDTLRMPSLPPPNG